VCIDDTGEYDAAPEIEHACARSAPRRDFLIGADGDNRITTHRKRLGNAARRILGVNSAVQQNEVGRRGRYSGVCPGKPRGECDQGERGGASTARVYRYQAIDNTINMMRSTPRGSPR
jgi:hypothetical protein